MKALLFIYSAILVLFFAKTAISLDPDFGWRLKAGELYISSGIPATDPYSYTMEEFPWVDHAWLQSVTIGFLYSRVGYPGLALIIASIGALSLIMVGKSISAKSIYVALPLMLGMPFLLSFMGVRAQIITWLMFAVFIKILFSPVLWERLKIFFPLIFLAWANLHGGFISGLIFISVVFITRSIRTRRLYSDDVFILLFSITATVFTPYNLGTWREVISSTIDSSLRWKIAEWKPTIFLFDIPLWFLVAFSAVLFYIQRSKITLEVKILYIFFLLQGIISRRNMPFWILIAIPTTTLCLNNMIIEIKKIKDAKEKINRLKNIFVVGVVVMVGFQVLLNLRGSLSISERNFYPVDAVVYLKENPTEGELISEYGWGGYLIWKLPEKKVFIDGRMPSWRWEITNERQSNSAFDEYLKLTSGEIEYKGVFEKYNIDTALFSLPANEGFYGLLANKIEEILVQTGKDQKEKFSLTEKLIEDGWKEKYKDNRAVVYQRN